MYLSDNTATYSIGRGASPCGIRLGDGESSGETSVGGDVIGRDKIINTSTTNYFYGVSSLASDATPLVGYTDEVVYLSDHELVLLSPEGIELIHRERGRTSPHHFHRA